jgi:hypothetical protein
MIKGLTSICIGVRNTDYPICHYTGNCIGNVKYFTDAAKTPYEIVVADNGSTCELGGWDWKKVVDKYYKEIEGKSCAWSWNKAIEMAEGEYIAVLSNDVQVFEHWLEDLIDATKYVDIVNACPMYDMPWGRALEASKRRIEWMMNDPDKYLYPFRDFSLFLAKREVFDKVGKFDENYEFGWGEDIDYCYRAQALGFVNKANKRVNTNHIGMATGQTLMMQNAGDINGAMTRNREYTREKHNLDKYGIPHPKGEVVEREKEQPLELSKDIKVKGNRTIRVRETGDKVYLVTGKIVQWVKNIETLNALGWRLGQEQIISLKELNEYEKGDDLTIGNIDMVGIKSNKSEIESVDDSGSFSQGPILRYRREA